MEESSDGRSGFERCAAKRRALRVIPQRIDIAADLSSRRGRIFSGFALHESTFVQQFRIDLLFGGSFLCDLQRNRGINDEMCKF